MQHTAHCPPSSCARGHTGAPGGPLHTAPNGSRACDRPGTPGSRALRTQRGAAPFRAASLKFSAPAVHRPRGSAWMCHRRGQVLGFSPLSPSAQGRRDPGLRPAPSCFSSASHRRNKQQLLPDRPDTWGHARVHVLKIISLLTAEPSFPCLSVQAGGVPFPASAGVLVPTVPLLLSPPSAWSTCHHASQACHREQASQRHP